jgi:hypothetical protein
MAADGAPGFRALAAGALRSKQPTCVAVREHDQRVGERQATIEIGIMPSSRYSAGASSLRAAAAICAGRIAAACDRCQS